MSNDVILVGIVAAPGVVFLVLAIIWLLASAPGERLIARTTSLVYAAMAMSGLWLGYTMIRDNVPVTRAAFTNWFEVGVYSFPLDLVADHLSLPLVVLTTVLIGIVGSFSVRYLHRERGYFRFFLLMHLFAFGALLAFTAGSFDLLIGGWEMVGITSVLLIAFFDERREPVRNGVLVFAYYRIADLGLLLAIFVMHISAHSASIQTLFGAQWPSAASTGTPGHGLPAEVAPFVGLLLLFAAAGKSAQIPFSGWLPRAMEGPTPSSAIFYGAISVHLGAYLLLRAESLYRAAPWAAAAVVAVGVLTALIATLAHRVSCDAKTSLAYAAMAQLGVIFVEIGLGYPRLALMHLCGHAAVRTLQFLRAPSMLHDFHRVHAAAGGRLEPVGEHYQSFLPEPIRIWLYRVALERGFYDAVLERLVAAPVLRFSRWLGTLEPRFDSKVVAKQQMPSSALREPSGIKEMGNQ